MSKTPSELLFGQDAEEYHAMPGASASRLNEMFRSSPAHMKHRTENPQPSTQPMVIGTATHSAILEPDLFDVEWGRIPEGDGRTSAVKKARAELIEEFGRDRVLKAETYDGIIGMRDSVLANETAKSLLHECNTEVSSYWRDGRSYLASTEDKVFPRDRFLFICVEKTAPYCVAVYELDEDSLTLARSGLEKLLVRWAECEAEDHWPAYPEGIQSLSLPAWAYVT